MDDNTNSDPVTIEQALDQIQNWINGGNSDMAREGLQEVLAMEPANSRALDLQNQLNNLGTAAPMQTPTMSDTPIPMSNDDIQIGGLDSEPVQAVETTATMSQPVPSGPIDLGYTPEVQPAETPAPMIDFSEPAFTSSPAPFNTVSQPEPAPASPSFEIPSTPPTFASETPQDELATETPSSPFSATVSEGITPEAQPELDATDKKAILMKALIPLGIAIILGIGIYFAYQYFSGDDSENTNTETPTNDIVTQPDTSEDVKDSDAADTETDSDTSDTDTEDTDTNSESDSDTSDTDTDTEVDGGGIIKDGKGETEEETKVKVKRPVKKATL